MEHYSRRSSGRRSYASDELCGAEDMVYVAIKSQIKSDSDRNLIQQIIDATKLTEFQVRAALQLLMQKNMIASCEIIDNEKR